MKTTLTDLLALAEGLDESGPNFREVRALKAAVRQLIKDQEVTA